MWEAIGATGEVLGAIGVIITLAYLATQVRQSSRLIERNTEATRVTADDAVVENFNDWRAMLVADPEVADIFARGMFEPRGLNRSERTRFNFMLGTFGWTAWQLWRVDRLLGTPNEHILRHLLLHEGGRMWYLDHRPFFPPDFRAAVDAELEDIEASEERFLTPSDPSSMFAGRLDLPGSAPSEFEPAT